MPAYTYVCTMCDDWCSSKTSARAAAVWFASGSAQGTSDKTYKMNNFIIIVNISIAIDHCSYVWILYSSSYYGH